MKIILRKIALLILLASLLPACGFRLRGASNLPNTIKFAVINGVAKYSDASLAVKQQLESAGAKVLSTADVDTVHFTVLQNKFTRRVLSVDASGVANEYELTYVFSMRVLDSKGKILVAERAIDLNRNYIYDPSNALAKSDEEANIKIQMISLAVRQSMRRIGIKLRQTPALNASSGQAPVASENKSNQPEIKDSNAK